MRIAHLGAGLRVVGDYVWARPGDAVEITDAETIVTLLLQPGETFYVAADEPLLGIVGNEHVVEHLALEGIGSLDELAELSARKAGTLAKAMGLGRDVVIEWVAEAGRILAE
jgi:hypothetical protein